MKKLEFPARFHIVSNVVEKTKKQRRKVNARIGRKQKGKTSLDAILDLAYFKAVLSTLKKEFKDVVKEYRKKGGYRTQEPGSNIWTMWWQGEDNAPLLVKRCIESIRRNAGDHEVVVIDQSNITDYIELPSYIMEKYDEGRFTATHLSEIVRIFLLAKYGGLWLDATVYCPKPIPDYIWELPLYSVHYYYDRKYPTYPFKLRVASYEMNYRKPFTDNILGGMSSHPLFCFTRDALMLYWSKHSYLMTYNTVGCTLVLAYKMIDLVRRDADVIPLNGNNRFILLDAFDNAHHDKNFFDKLKSIDDTYFYKLCWKRKPKEYTEDGRETVYKRFLDEAL